MQATTRCVRLETCAVWSYCSLGVRDFILPSHHILIPLFSNVRDRFRRIGVRPRGWTVRLPCTLSVAQITLQQLGHTVSHMTRARLLSCWRDARHGLSPCCIQSLRQSVHIHLHMRSSRRHLATAKATLEPEPTQHNSLDRLQIRK